MVSNGIKIIKTVQYALGLTMTDLSRLLLMMMFLLLLGFVR